MRRSFGFLAHASRFVAVGAVVAEGLEREAGSGSRSRGIARGGHKSYFVQLTGTARIENTSRLYFSGQLNHFICMSTIAQKLAHDALALSEEERMEIFVQLATSLPAQKTIIVESTRRAEEMTNGAVMAMTEIEFQEKMDRLRGEFRKQA